VKPRAVSGLDNPFCLVVVTAQRARQLKDGARPRLDNPGGHKTLRLALLEVQAGLVSWETTQAEPS